MGFWACGVGILIFWLYPYPFQECVSYLSINSHSYLIYKGVKKREIDSRVLVTRTRSLLAEKKQLAEKIISIVGGQIGQTNKKKNFSLLGHTS